MIQDLLNKLEKVKRVGHGKWVARCPCHSDRTPSLSIRDDNGTILIHCFGCGVSGLDVCTAVGMDVSDLFPEIELDYSEHTKRKPGLGRLGITPDHALHALQQECMVIFIIASDMLENGSIDKETKDRLTQAVSRVHAVTAFYK